MNGKIIVIDGMDGTGKETQSNLLYEKLKEKTDKVELFSFPNYDNDSSYFVRKFLKEGYCRDIDLPLLKDMFYSIDRGITYHKELKEKYEDGYTFILDRYTISNAIYRLNESENSADYLMDLAFIEHVCLKLPDPYVNIILYSYPEVNIKLIESRCKINNIKKDLNENIDIQNIAYENIKALNQNGVSKLTLGPIETLLIHDENGNIHSKEYMNEQIMRIVDEIYF